MTGGCPSRLGDLGTWCDTHGGVIAVCTVCEALVSVVSWVNPSWAYSDVTRGTRDAWLIGAHQVFDPVAFRNALGAHFATPRVWHEFDCGALYGDKPHWHPVSDLAGTR